MNVLIITTHFPPKKGGVETSIVHYLDFFEQKENFQVVVLTYENRYREKFEDYWQKSKILRIKVPIALLEYIISLKSVSRMNSFCRKFLYLFLHTFFLGIGSLIHLKKILEADKIIAKGALIECIVTYALSIVIRKKYAVRWHTDLSDTLSNAVTALTLRRASSIVVNGIDVKEKMCRLTRHKGKRILVLRHSVDADIFKPIPQNKARITLNLPQSKFIVLFAAALNKVKFCDLVVGGASFLFEKNPDIFFVMIGEGPLEETIRAIARSRSKSILFIDHFLDQETLSLFINASDILIGSADIYYPSRIVLESLACGTPILLFNTSGHIEKRKAKLQFRMPLPNVFVIEPSQDEFIKFLLTNKTKIQQIRKDLHLIMRSRQYVLGHYKLKHILTTELKILLD